MTSTPPTPSDDENSPLLKSRLTRTPSNGRVLEAGNPSMPRYDSAIGMDSEECEAFWRQNQPPEPEEETRQTSIVTIFAIWSSMMGTSLLTMPWAFQQAGLIQAIFLQLLTASLAAYTGMLVLKSSMAISDDGHMTEFAVVCQRLLGKFGTTVTTLSTIVVFVGALIVYWILMSELLYKSVNSIHYFSSATTLPNGSDSYVNNVTLPPDGTPTDNMVPANGNGSNASCVGEEDFPATAHLAKIPAWSENRTVPFFLVIIFAPLIQLRSPSFFTRFGATGTIPVMFLIVYAIVKSASWGLNVDFENEISPHHVDYFNGNFPALSGLLSMAFFQHNSIVTFFKHSKKPEKSFRDLWLAYGLVVFTYGTIGISIYLAYPEHKACIKQNFFQNISPDDPLSLVAQLMLFLRLVTLFPLVAYILRVQIFLPVAGSEYPSHVAVGVLNVIIVSLCVFCAVFYPNIGDIVRYAGAFCGMLYMFLLPCLIDTLLEKRKEKITGQKSSTLRHIFHTFIAVFGIVNFFAQFAVST